MQVTKTKLNDVLIFEPEVFGDERGFFMETFRKDFFTEQTGVEELVQDNHSKSAQGILRGLHYQLEHTQGKLVRVTQGSVFDVAVDYYMCLPILLFDGNKTTPYQTDDQPNPVNVYGASKLAGEQSIVQTLPDAVIVRTAWVYSLHGNNFVKSMLRLMTEKPALGIVYDQVGTPTWAAGLAKW